MSSPSEEAQYSQRQTHKCKNKYDEEEDNQDFQKSRNHSSCIVSKLSNATSISKVRAKDIASSLKSWKVLGWTEWLKGNFNPIQYDS